MIGSSFGWRTLTRDMQDSSPRLAELIGGLSLATDLAAGLGYETALRCCLAAVRLGRVLGLQGEALRDIYFTGLLRFVGCTAYAHETARDWGAGNDQAALRALTPADPTKPADVLGHAIKGIAPGAGPLRRAWAIARLAADPKGPRRLADAHCDLAMALATRLGMSEGVIAALGQIYERYDGKGLPHGMSGEQIPLPARVMHVAWRVEVHRALEGPRAAVGTVRERRGAEFDPALADAFLADAGTILEQLAAPSVWDEFLAAEPRPVRRIGTEGVRDVALAFAHYVDIKSPYTLGHSIGVARLAEAAASKAGLSEEAQAELAIAGLLHDIGRVSVPNGIWDKQGPLNAAEWERVRQHPYQTERILSFSPLFQRYAPIAARHHERSDGSGYHRGLPDSALTPPARLLAAADAYQAMTEDRPHRRALPPAEAARTLADEASAGRLEGAAVEHVLAAAGQRGAGQLRGERPAALSEREVEVLCLVARGLSNREIAERLIISPATAKRHVENIYAKTGITGRAGAAVFAVRHELL